MTITILKPSAYCSGVTRAISLVKKEREDNPNTPIFILGMLVHNTKVIDELTKLNIVTLKREGNDEDILRSIPKKSIVVFSAHGHDPKLNRIAKELDLIPLDCVCPKVSANLSLVQKELQSDNDVIFIGEKEHPETKAFLSLSDKVHLYDERKLKNNYLSTKKFPLVINQTTMNISSIKSIYDEILNIYPEAKIANEICSTTRLRQESIINIDKTIDLLLIVGSTMSSNTKRLLEISKMYHPNLESYILNDSKDIDLKTIIKNKKHIAIASGASASNENIQEIISFIKSLK